METEKETEATDSQKNRLSCKAIIVILAFLVFFVASTIGIYKDYSQVFDHHANGEYGDIRKSVPIPLREMDLPKAPVHSNAELAGKLDAVLSRLDAIEAESHRLSNEMTELSGDDGVINRMLLHVRELQAQNEATRRDVAEALTSAFPSPKVPATADDDGMLDGPLDGSASSGTPLRARHMIVTPPIVRPVVAESTPRGMPSRGSVDAAERGAASPLRESGTN